MKKLFFIFCFIVTLLVGCKKPAPETAAPNTPAPAVEVSACTLNGSPCWDIVQILGQTETVYPEGKTTCYFGSRKNLCTYKNSALESKGLSVTDLEIFRDGGSEVYKVFDGTSKITFFINRRIGSPEQGHVEISWPDKSGFVFDKTGRMIEQIPAASCTVGEWLCTDFARRINEIFKMREEFPQAVEQPDGSLLQRICRGEVCNETMYDTELNALDLTPADHHEENGIHTYHLPDGKELIFNWQPGSPEHGFLTVIQTDGSQKKFDYVGWEIKE